MATNTTDSSALTGRADTPTSTSGMWASSFPKDADEATDPKAGGR